MMIDDTKKNSEYFIRAITSFIVFIFAMIE